MKKRYTTIISSLFLIGICSCDSYLSHLPDDRAQIDSPESVKELLVSGYPDASYMAFCETMSDNVSDKGPKAFDIDGVSYEQNYFWKEQTAISQDTYNYYWSSCYGAIAAINHAYQAIDESVNKDLFITHKGEALVARAYNHFMLANVFCEHFDPSKNASQLGIPYVLEPENVVFKDYKRGTLEKTYEAIRKDLEEGLPLIDNRLYEVQSFHFNLDAANTFASRFYLYTAEWDKVIEHCNKVLVGDYASRLRQLNSSTHIEKNYEEKKLFYTNSLEPANLLLAGAISTLGQTLGIHRYDFTIKEFDEFYLKPEIVPGMHFSYVSDFMGDAEKVFFLPKLAEHMKQIGLNANTGYPYIMAPLFTMEEALLNRAEAYAMTNQFDLALEDINLFLSNRLLTIDLKTNTVTGNNDYMEYLNKERLLEIYKDYKPELTPFYMLLEDQRSFVNCITDFRRKEFLQEGMRWFDIKRFHIEVMRVPAGLESDEVIDVLTKDDLRRAVQIPQDAIANGIERNPR